MIPVTVPKWKIVGVMKVLLLFIMIKGKNIMTTWFVFMLCQIIRHYFFHRYNWLSWRGPILQCQTWSWTSGKTKTTYILHA